MNKIFSKTNFISAVCAIAVTAVMVFAVLPQMPQAATTFDTISTSAASVFAWGTGEYGDGCCGERGDGGPDHPERGDGGPTPTPAAQCDFLTASRTSVPHGGGNVTLKWGTTNATSVSLTGFSSVNDDGSRTVHVTKATTFTLKVHGHDSFDSCTVKITVEKPTPKPAVCDFLTASRTTVPHGGGNVTLKWGTTNATSVSLTGFGFVNADGSRTVHVTTPTTFTLTAKGTGGNDTCTVKVNVEKKPTPKPVAQCDFLKSNKATVPHGGGNVVLSWGTTNATSVSINGGVGTVAADGSVTVHVTKDTTFTLTAKGTGGNDTCAVKVTVQKKPVPTPPAVCDFLTASRTTVPHGGGNVTLKWGTTNATSVSLTGFGFVNADGSRTVHVTTPTTFTLTAKGAGGNDTCTVKVNVEKKPTPKPAAQCDFLVANRTTVPFGGGNVTLKWGTTNATSVTINGLGAVSADGSEVVSVTKPTTFTLTAKGAGGNDTCTVDIKVGKKPEKPDEPTPRCDFFNVSDDEVEEGDEVTLEWETTNADDVFIDNGIGHVADDGDRRVEIDDDITYTLTVSNGGKEDTCSVHIEVEEEEEEDDENLRCDLEISDKKVNEGDEVTLEWDVRDADEFTIEDDHGNTIHRDRNPGSRERGEEEVTVTRDTEFTLIAEGEGSDEEECRVEVEVEDSEVLVLTERDQGKIAGISLTQVPYTGFEAGAVLTFLFYALLTAWALFIAYTLVIKKDSILGFSLAGAATAEPVREVVHEAYVASAAPAAVADTPINLPTGMPVYGYASVEAETEEHTEEADDLKALEDQAHAARVLFSSDAFRYFRTQTEGDQFAALDALIASARATFPSEDGWIVLNLARIEELMGKAAFVPKAAEAAVGSLAEAIATGNIAAAYQLIEHRPMIALADAAAEFDAIYRMYQGNPTGTVIVSDLLKAEVAKHTRAELSAAIDALTSALDGTYTDEEAAVKMAIMKAVAVFAN